MALRNTLVKMFSRKMTYFIDKHCNLLIVSLRHFQMSGKLTVSALFPRLLS